MAEPKNKKKTKEHDSSKYIDLEPTIDEAAGKTAVIAWGRMNPITAGHEKLANRVKAVAKSEKGEPMIFLTHSVDKKKNPLKYDDKIRYAQKAFGSAVKKSNSKTIIQVMVELQGKYKNLVLVAGSDRVDEFQQLLNKYNGKDYSFDSIKVVSAGQRDPDSDAVDGISGTKMREFAAKNDATNFAKNLPRNLRPSASEIIDVVRDGMGMSEEVELDEVLDRQQRRKRALAMKRARFKIKRGREKAMRKVASTDVLKKRAHKAAIKTLKNKFSKGRYADMSAGEKMTVDKKIEKINKKRIEAIARKLFPSIKKLERERKSNMAKGGSTNESINEASKVDTQVRARPHMLMDKNNKPKIDGRFKMFKKKVNESVEDLNEEILDLMEATEALAEKELEERSTGDAIKSMVGRVLNKGNYKAALEYMKKSGKSAADVARIYKGVDARTLASMAESVELDELEEAMTAEKILGSKPSQRYKSKDQWISAARDMGLKVKSPSTTPEGDNNKDIFLTAFDRNGNMKGAWYKKDGVLKESQVNEGVDYHAAFKKITDTMKPGTTKYVGRAEGKEITAKKDKNGNVKFYYKDGIKGSLKLVKESVELEEAKGKLVKNMRVKHMYTGKKGTVIKGGDRAGGRVEVEWEDGVTNVVAGKYLEKFKESVQIDESWKINKNTYFMGKDVGPVRTHHSGYSIAKIGKDWVVSNPDDEEAGKFKSLAAAKSEVASMVNESARERALTPSYGRRDTYRDKMKRGANELKKQLARKRGEGEQLKLKFEDLRAKLGEKLTAKDDAGEWVKDFQDSDAPQFKGKSDEKKRKMAIAAFLDAKRKAKNEEAGAGEEGTNKLVKRYKKDTPNA